MRPFADHPETKHAGRGLLVMLGGVVMGAGVAFLTAPQSGERTRRHIVRRAEDAKAQVAEWCDDVTERVEDLRRGIGGKRNGSKEYLARARRALLPSTRGRPSPLNRLIRRLRG